MSGKKIVVVGSSNIDMIVKVDRLPRPGESILGGVFTTAAGGKGANQAVGAARAGGEVTFIARLGQDIYGESALAGFVRDGINVEHITRDPDAPSGVALIFVAGDGENCIAVAPGANANFAPADVIRARAVLADAAVLLTQLEMPLETVLATVELATQFGARVILNPAPARVLPDILLAQISILTPNESEAEMLTGIAVKNEATAVQAAEILLARGVSTVILTLGARGALVAGDDTGGKIRSLLPAFKVEAVDTTAAGDVFNGALATALAEECPLLEAVRFANAAAAISVTRLGAQPSAPTRAEIEAFLKRE
jgi:ribokinase